MKFRKCSVEGCISTQRNPKISFFTPPKNSYLEWKKAISNANLRDSSVKFVCADHFLPEEIITTYALPQDVSAAMGSRLHFGLKKGSVPSVFTVDRKIKISFPFELDHNYARKPRTNDEKSCNIDIVEKHNIDENLELQSFNALTNNFKRVVLPEGWSTFSSTDEIVFYKSTFMDGKLQIEKQMIFKNTSEICVYLYQLLIQCEKLSTKLKFPISVRDISVVIAIFNFKNFCKAGPSSVDFPEIRVKTAVLENNKLWRHKKCPIILDLKTRCKACDFLIRYFRKCVSRNTAKQISYIECTLSSKRFKTLKSLLDNGKILKKSNISSQTIIGKLNLELEELQKKIKMLPYIYINEVEIPL